MFHVSVLTATDGVDSISMCNDDDVDQRWGLVWTATVAGSRDSQPCPAISGVQSVGFAFRLCDSDGQWDKEVDVSMCSSAAFDEIERNAVRHDKHMIGKDSTQGAP
jgi:hypothetical protein